MLRLVFLVFEAAKDGVSIGLGFLPINEISASVDLDLGELRFNLFSLTAGPLEVLGDRVFWRCRTAPVIGPAHCWELRAFSAAIDFRKGLFWQRSGISIRLQ
jgi:hypothetical protein